eukprot:255025-Chlamydomonas_euryale.AAC.1
MSGRDMGVGARDGRRGGRDAGPMDWKSRNPPPPMSGRSMGSRGGMSGGMGGGMLPSLHRSEHRFVVGQQVSDDPEEAAKQKQFKGILNKLTIDNFEKLSVRILEVGIVERKTLEGLINQIFD